MSYLMRTALQHINAGATFAKMEKEKGDQRVIYWLKYPSRDGFQIHVATGRALEQRGHIPTIWRYDP